MRPDQVASAYFIGACFDNRNGVRIKVADDQLAAIRFQGQIGRSFADIKQGQKFVILKIDRGYLGRSGASNEGFAAVRENGNVFGLMANRYRVPHRKSLRIDERDRVA